MKDYNAYLRGLPEGSIFESVMPQTYIASTLGDFVSNIGMVEPTKKFTVPAAYYTGKAFIMIKNSLLYTPIDDKTCTLSDLTTTVDVALGRIAHMFLRGIEEPERINGVLLSYFIERDSLLLKAFNPFGPPGAKKFPVQRSAEELLVKVQA